VDEPAVKRRDTTLEAAETARCRGKEDKKLCIVSILLLIDNVRGYISSNR